MSTWSSGIGKFLKKDPDHGKWGRKIKHWLCKIGICNTKKCDCDCHEGCSKKKDIPRDCKVEGCPCKK